MFNNNFVFALLLCNYCRAIRAQSLAAPVILSVINVPVILLFQTNKLDDTTNIIHLKTSSSVYNRHYIDNLCTRNYCSIIIRQLVIENVIVSIAVLTS